MFTLALAVDRSSILQRQLVKQIAISWLNYYLKNYLELFIIKIPSEHVLKYI